MQFTVTSEDSIFSFDHQDIDALELFSIGNNRFHYIQNNECFELELIEINRKTKKVDILLNKEKFSFSISGPLELLIEKMGLNESFDNSQKELKAPMPSLILDILIKEGQTVSKNDDLIVLEAMKMENILKSDGEGVVKSIHVSKGDSVDKHQILLELE